LQNRWGREKRDQGNFSHGGVENNFPSGNVKQYEDPDSLGSIPGDSGCGRDNIVPNLFSFDLFLVVVVVVGHDEISGREGKRRDRDREVEEKEEKERKKGGKKGRKEIYKPLS
jgi:hypothetical protein